MRVTVAAGGTAGHLAPALVIADELRSRGHDVSFIASSGRADESVVSARGFDVLTYPIGGLPRTPGLAQVRALWQAAVAIPRCVRMLRSLRPAAVLGGGGYVSAPVAVAAWLLRVPVVVTEADAHLGLANRIAGRFARRLCSAYPLPEFTNRQVVVGRPVDPAFFAIERAEARRRLSLPQEQVVVSVVGGSGGATRLSDAVYEAFAADPELLAGGRPFALLHVTGRRDYGRYASRGTASADYRLIDYCDDMPALLAASDLVVSRAGGSVFELAAVGVAAVLVPGALAGDHQRKNARWFAGHQAVVVVDTDDCTASSMARTIRHLAAPGSDVERDRLATAMHALARPDSASAIADVVEQEARTVPAARS